ncbi:hypothetical protein [Jonquetella anthropi]|uniref:hypothetical protein n=1 Tax=Jonquetella anthropi TaxID=428712 RepID=UPI0023F3A851|nr:hypothetical protein [Jonquetella anthropi]
MELPLWDGELSIEVGSWISYVVASRPLSMLETHGPVMKTIGEGAMALQSEFLYLCGVTSGLSGAMIWDAPLASSVEPLSPLFTVVFGYSLTMEDFLARFVTPKDELVAGVTWCTFWRADLPLGKCKALALLGSLPLIDEDACLSELARALSDKKLGNWQIPYFAETYGFLRAPVMFETDRTSDLMIEKQLESFQLDATHNVLGPSPRLSLPPFYQGV